LSLLLLVAYFYIAFFFAALLEPEEQPPHPPRGRPQAPPPPGRHGQDANPQSGAPPRNPEAHFAALLGLLTHNQQDNTMNLLHHFYTWNEAVPDDDQEAGRTMRLTWLTVDVLLPGPTGVEQIEVQVEDDTNLKVTYKPPSTYLSSRRTAVHAADIAGIDTTHIPLVLPHMQAISHVQGHVNALANIWEEQKQISFIIKLPFPVDSSFCRRDDWGCSNRAEGVSIGAYRHDNQEFQASNQAVWILQVELTSKARPKSTPSKPTQFGIFVDNA
jgi:hypothetical protein